ncbi:MAG TPA: subtilase-type protease inhibitor [Actinomycetota bacterium]
MMIRTARLLTGTLVAGLLLTAVAAIPAAAGTRVTESIRPAGYARSVMKLTINDGETYDPGTARRVKLTCDPAGGTHPDPKTACEQLHEVDGDFAKLDVNPGPCPLIYRPVTATAKGSWQGSPVDYQETFSNSCDLARQTGAVFAF